MLLVGVAAFGLSLLMLRRAYRTRHRQACAIQNSQAVSAICGMTVRSVQHSAAWTR